MLVRHAQAGRRGHHQCSYPARRPPTGRRAPPDLAQQTPLLLLDEPTTYLDIAHQIEILDLCARLHEEQGRTLVAVLHDLNQAACYATHLIVLRQGRVAASGPPGQIVTAELVETVFGLPCRVIEDPETGTPLVVPGDRRRREAWLATG